MIVQYKCPNCGADMVFSSQTGNLACQSCGHHESIEDRKEAGSAPSGTDPADGTTDSDTKEIIGDFEEFESQTSSNTFSDDEVNQYQCSNCGAVLITDEHTTATNCSFCGSPVMLGDRLSGALAPSYVLPFTISKEQAQEAFMKWCKKGLLTPKDFKHADRIKNITGMYVPFWLFDLNGRGEITAVCTRVRSYTRGDYIYTETSYYDVYRKVDLNYLRVPADASKKMNDSMMDKLEPFPYENLKEFKVPYLAGYIAEKYNYSDKELFPRVKTRAAEYVNSFINSTISGYATTSYTSRTMDVLQRNAEYTLIPVWMVCYDYNRSEHTFAMNGQTGKLVGKPPISKGKILSWFGLLSGAALIIIKIIVFLLGGGLL